MTLPAEENTGIQIGIVYPPQGENETPPGKIEGITSINRPFLQNIDPKSGVGTITYQVTFSNPSWMATGMIIYFVERATALTKADVKSLGTAVSPFNPYQSPFVSKQLGKRGSTYQFGVIVTWQKNPVPGKPIETSEDFSQTTTNT